MSQTIQPQPLETPPLCLTSSDYINLPDEATPWIVRDLLPTGGLLNIFGPAKVGKSYACLQLANAIANPEEDNWLSFPIERHGPVLYVQIDTPRSLWKMRLKQLHALPNRHGEAGTHWLSPEVYIADRQIAPFPFNILQLESGAAWLLSTCRAVKPVVVFFDVLRELAPVDENSSGEMMQAINAFVKIITPAAGVFISHPKKENTQTPAADRDNLINDNRGSNFVAGRMDGLVKITKRQLIYQSRTVEEGKIKLNRDRDTGLWLLDSSEFDRQVRSILDNKTVTSLRERARMLSELSGRSFNTCHNALRKHAKS